MRRVTTNLLTLIVLLAFCCKASESAQGFGPGEQDWGFLDVREGAHMFYWLYYTTANVSSYTQRPLVIWQVGGPGSSSTAYGNFDEVGPLTLEGDDRYFSWDKYVNLLFVDSPVGSGFSYVDDESLLTTTNKQIALDFVSFMKAFYAKHPDFESVPLHLFGESYGGKMIIEMSLELYRAIERGELQSNFKSVTMVSPRIAHLESTMSWGPFVLSMGIVDMDGYEATMIEANKYKELFTAKNYTGAVEQVFQVAITAYNNANGFNFYNILRDLPVMGPTSTVPDFNADRFVTLLELMNGKIAKALKLNNTFNKGSDVKSHLRDDMEVPIVDIIVEVLDTTDLEVSIVCGQLDLVAGPLGFVEFMKNLNWSYKSDYEAAPREGFSVNGVLEGYKKGAGKFNFLWANRGGHMISQDNPAALNYILKYVTKYKD